MPRHPTQPKSSLSFIRTIHDSVHASLPCYRRIVPSDRRWEPKSWWLKNNQNPGEPSELDAFILAGGLRLGLDLGLGLDLLVVSSGSSGDLVVVVILGILGNNRSLGFGRTLLARSLGWGGLGLLGWGGLVIITITIGGGGLLALSTGGLGAGGRSGRGGPSHLLLDGTPGVGGAAGVGHAHLASKLLIIDLFAVVLLGDMIWGYGQQAQVGRFFLP